ncbi:hypothetical protein EVAR_4363_1 [Eumeta japonica]|uniref:Uncharacterized protein n=1 Tax=Eumeta variegata TaxID=151549 RepID=A0A4C1T053_EUMVA|nr:hypothetical protein EVAR_4363_1 [Eumeta japonica]
MPLSMRAVPCYFYFELGGLEVKTYMLVRCGSGLARHRYYKRSDSVRDRRLNVLFEARSAWFNLSKMKNSLANRSTAGMRALCRHLFRDTEPSLLLLLLPNPLSAHIDIEQPHSFGPQENVLYAFHLNVSYDINPLTVPLRAASTSNGRGLWDTKTNVA